MSSHMHVFRKDEKDQTQSCCLFVEVSMVAVSKQLTVPGWRVKVCVARWRSWLGKPELLQGGASFATSFEHTLEVAVWYLHPPPAGEASPRPSLKLWLTFCREHEKLPWARNLGFLVLQSNNDLSDSLLTQGRGRSTKHLKWQVTDSLPKDLSTMSVMVLPMIMDVLAPVQPQ